DTPIRTIARVLVDKGISAVPVVDDDGMPIGMVSEGDLVGRNQTEREARRDWWLTLLAEEGETLSPEFLANLHSPKGTARDIMSSPVITVDENTDAGAIARPAKRASYQAGTSCSRWPNHRDCKPCRSFVRIVPGQGRRVMPTLTVQEPIDVFFFRTACA